VTGWAETSQRLVHVKKIFEVWWLVCWVEIHIKDIYSDIYSCRFRGAWQTYYILGELHSVGINKFLSVFLNESKLLRQQRRPADCSIEQVQRWRTLAWQVLCAFAKRSDAAWWQVWESVMRCDHSAVNSVRQRWHPTSLECQSCDFVTSIPDIPILLHINWQCTTVCSARCLTTLEELIISLNLHGHL